MNTPYDQRPQFLGAEGDIWRAGATGKFASRLAVLGSGLRRDDSVYCVIRCLGYEQCSRANAIVAMDMGTACWADVRDDFGTDRANALEHLCGYSGEEV